MGKLKKLSLMLALMLPLVTLVVSCGPKIGGDTPENHLPLVFLSNVPPAETHFSTNAELFWYGLDDDGYVIAYEYSVVRVEDMLGYGVDITKSAEVLAFAEDQIVSSSSAADCDPACWQILYVDKVDSPNKQIINLFAGDDPEDTVEQFFFLRSVDDDSARSEVDFRLFSRNNHPPETEINFSVPADGVFYDWFDTTDYWKGIAIAWEGSDTSDYADSETPEFEFFWQLFGPYSDSASAQDADTSHSSDELLAQSLDTLSGSAWVKEESTLLFNLFGDFATSTVSGYFLFKVTSRDDAFVSDTIPATVVFNAVRPGFEEDILVTELPFKKIANDPGEIVAVNEDGVEEYNLVIEHYRTVFSAAGYPLPDSLPSIGQPKDVLARYKLVIALGEGAFAGPSPNELNALADYMNMGGSVWLWSTYPFQQIGSGSPIAGFKPGDVSLTHFDVTKVYRSDFAKSFVELLNACPEPPCPITNEEFVEALPLPGTEFADDQIRVDLDHLSAFQFTTDPGSSLFINWHGAPNVNYFVRDIFSEPLFLFKSYYGDFVPDSLKEWVPGLNGKVVALRNDTGRFKSAVFGFSLWSIREDDAIILTEKMIYWFLQD